MKILTWHIPDGFAGTGEQGFSYYIDQDYTPEEVHVKAVIAPDAGDMQLDIKADGVSLLNEYVVVTRDDTENDMPANFKESQTVNEGEWITLEPVNLAGAKNISVNLVLRSVGDETD